MASINEIKAAIARAQGEADKALALVAQLSKQIETARGILIGVSHGADSEELKTAINMLNQANDNAKDKAGGLVAKGMEKATNYAARL